MANVAEIFEPPLRVERKAMEPGGKVLNFVSLEKRWTKLTNPVEYITAHDSHSAFWDLRRADEKGFSGTEFENARAFRFLQFHAVPFRVEFDGQFVEKSSVKELLGQRRACGHSAIRIFADAASLNALLPAYDFWEGDAQ